MQLSPTEEQNQNTLIIDEVSVEEAVRLINDEDKLVAEAVTAAIPAISQVTEKTIDRLSKGGRVFYIGTGTSGRLGVLDASEIPPTYGVSPDLFQGIIAGGYEALYKAVEASEDDSDAGIEDLKARNITANDVIIGIAASGNTPYTVGAVEYARSQGCFTAAITSNPNSKIVETADVPIVVETGAEPVTGSTRMKAGTAAKLTLNMISTVTMIKLGYVKGNRMTNLKSSNIKLVDRSLRILAGETGLEYDAAGDLFSKAGQDLRIALVMHRAGIGPIEAKIALEKTDFKIDEAIKLATGRQTK